MTIRRAQLKDMPGINTLLCQVLSIHHNGRPDLFKAGSKKYTDSELSEIISDDKSPVFIAADNEDNVLGYAFCIFKQLPCDNILTDIKTLYIDDLCVDENVRGQHIGRKLYDYVVDFSKAAGCYNLTLNVWACNTDAMKFYEKCGLVPQKVGLEKIL